MLFRPTVGMMVGVTVATAAGPALRQMTGHAGLFNFSRRAETPRTDSKRPGAVSFPHQARFRIPTLREIDYIRKCFIMSHKEEKQPDLLYARVCVFVWEQMQT